MLKINKRSQLFFQYLSLGISLQMVLYSKRFYGGYVSNRNKLCSCMVLILGEIEPNPWCNCLKVLLNDYGMHGFS